MITQIDELNELYQEITIWHDSHPGLVDECMSLWNNNNLHLMSFITMCRKSIKHAALMRILLGFDGIYSEMLEKEKNKMSEKLRKSIGKIWDDAETALEKQLNTHSYHTGYDFGEIEDFLSQDNDYPDDSFHEIIKEIIYERELFGHNSRNAVQITMRYADSKAEYEESGCVFDWKKLSVYANCYLCFGNPFEQEADKVATIYYDFNTQKWDTIVWENTEILKEV